MPAAHVILHCLAAKSSEHRTMTNADIPQPPRQTAGAAPVRSPDSVRRTSSIDVTWPEGQGGDRHFLGRVRDYLTPANGGIGRALDTAEFRARLGGDKTIRSIEAEPAPAGLPTLVGVRGGNHLRMFIKETMPDLIARADPLYLVLDDISGTALVSPVAWPHYHQNWDQLSRMRLTGEERERFFEGRIDVCWGLARGNSGVRADGPATSPPQAEAGDLRNPADPQGWHELPETDEPHFRRARRIDVTRDRAEGIIRIEAAFQDSSRRASGGRVAIHEYSLAATASLESGELIAIEAYPHILPFGECPGAVGNIQRLVGLPLSEMRQAVIELLRGTAGCTHLNDAMRALAEVPRLVAYLD